MSKLENYEDGDRVWVRWYGGTDFGCVVLEEDGEKFVQRETSPGVGTGTVLTVGEMDSVEEPKGWGTVAKHLVEKRKMQSSYDAWDEGSTY
jgi:hypothetical protein